MENLIKFIMVIILYKTLKKTRRIYAQKDSAVFQINLKYLIFNNLKTLEDISNAPNSTPPRKPCMLVILPMTSCGVCWLPLKRLFRNRRAKNAHEI